MKKIVVVLTSILIIVSCLISSSASSSSSFVSDLSPVSSFTDSFGIRHDFFALYSQINDSGVLIEVVHSPQSPATLSFYSDNLLFTFRNISTVKSDCFVNCRNLKSGYLYYSAKISVSPSSSSSFYYNDNSLDSDVISILPLFVYFNKVVFFDNQFSIDIFDQSKFSTGSILFNGKFSEEGYILSPLVEPVADDLNRFFVRANDNEAQLFVLSFYAANGSLSFQSITCALTITSSGDFVIHYKNNSDYVVSFSLTIYDISNGFYIYSNYRTLASGESGSINANSYLEYPSFQVFGMSLVNNFSYNINLPKILWNYDSVNIQFQGAQTLLLLNQLYSINSKLVDINANLSFHFELVFSYFEQLLDVFNNPGQEYTQPPTDALDDYLSDESKVYDVLPTGMQENIDTAFGSADVVFSGNGAFGLIRGLMQGLVFDVPKLSGFVFFALAVGIAVLILGRKING